jgi:nitrogen regulatory protein P-II 1
MKKIEAIIRTDKLEDLKKAMAEAKMVHGVTVSQILGFGNQRGFDEYVRGQKIVVSLLAKVKLEIVVDDEEVDGLVDIIVKAARTGEVGDGKIFVTPIDEVVRIRTGERGSAAL